MVERLRIDFGELQAKCLVLLYSRFVADISGMSVAQIAVKLKSPRNAVRLVVRGEESSGRCLEYYHGPVGAPGRFAAPFVVGAALAALTEGYDESKIYRVPDDREIEITQAGVEWVNDLPDSEYSRYLEPLNVESAKNEGKIPASDRTVTLNHNQPEYLEAVASLDKAIEAFDEDRCLDNELGPDKTTLRKSLEVAREFIQLREINARIGLAMIVEPLQYLAKKYETAIAGAALGQLFRLAADKILALFN